MTLTVLTDAEIRPLLEGLTASELAGFQRALKETLHQYSTGAQLPEKDQGSIHQPERISVHNKVTGATTLFMPSCSPAGQGVKVITLSSAENQQPPQTGESAEAEGQEPGTETKKKVIKPTGAITLFDPEGSPAGILHASTLTAFRTALASVSLVDRRDKVETLTVFGVGEQAYWHVRLSLMVRGSTIRQVNFINRRFSPACKEILRRFLTTGTTSSDDDTDGPIVGGVPAETKTREGWTDCKFGILTPTYNQYSALLAQQVRDADVIFCCTPSTEALFDGRILTEDNEARKKGRLIVAIGSYTPQMREIPLELIRQATKQTSHEHQHKLHLPHIHIHRHKHAVEGGVVIVDTLDGALKEAGELIEAGLVPSQLVE